MTYAPIAVSYTHLDVYKRQSYLYIKMGITMFISLYITRLILNSLGDVYKRQGAYKKY